MKFGLLITVLKPSKFGYSVWNNNVSHSVYKRIIMVEFVYYHTLNVFVT